MIFHLAKVLFIGFWISFKILFTYCLFLEISKRDLKYQPVFFVKIILQHWIQFLIGQSRAPKRSSLFYQLRPMTTLTTGARGWDRGWGLLRRTERRSWVWRRLWSWRLRLTGLRPVWLLRESCTSMSTVWWWISPVHNIIVFVVAWIMMLLPPILHHPEITNNYW